MIDIFLSYASANRINAETLANVIQKLGWTIWWDRQIPIGLTYDEVIDKNLKAAKCVMVLWTRASAASEWVRNEASEGAKRKILIPILLEDIEIPLEFRRNQAAKLIGWQSASQYHPEFQKLYTRLTELLGNPRYIPEGPPFSPVNPEPSPILVPSPQTGMGHEKKKYGEKKKFIAGAVILSAIVVWLLISDNNPPIVPSSAKSDESSQLKLNMTAEENYQKGKQLLDSKNYKEAFNLFEAAAHQNHTEAMKMVIQMYIEGTGVDIDHEKADEWITKALNKTTHD